MFDLLFEVIVIFFLIIECVLIWIWMSEHSTLMSIITHHISEIRKNVQNEKSRDDAG